MANRSQALYLRQLYRVRQKAQRRLPNELLETAGRIETHLAAQPKFTDETFCNHLNTPYIQVDIKNTRVLGLFFHSAISSSFARSSRARSYRRRASRLSRGNRTAATSKGQRTTVCFEFRSKKNKVAGRRHSLAQKRLTAIFYLFQ